MKHYLLIAFMLISSKVLAEKPLEKRVDIVVGIDKILNYDFAADTKVQVGDGSIVSPTLVPSKREIILKGTKPGSTNVTLRNRVGDVKLVYLVSVTETDQSKIVSELNELIGDVEGIEIVLTEKSNKILVKGHIIVPDEIGKVFVILKQYPDVINLVELSPHSQRIVARKMQDEIQRTGMKNVRVRIVNKLFFLEGVVTSVAQKNTAQRIAIAYLPDNIESVARREDVVQRLTNKEIIQNFISVNAKSKPQKIPKLIQVTGQFVELTKDYNKIFGFRWTPLISNGGGQIDIGKTGDGVTTKSSNTLQSTISNLFPKLDNAKNAGYARVLQSGVIIMQEGQDTAVIKRKEVRNSSVGSGETQTAIQGEQSFSIEVKTPRILPGEKIDMGLGIEVSFFVSTGGSDDLSNSISTRVIIKNNETAVIGGIVTKKSSTAYDKNTGDSEVEGGSPLFSFIRSKSYISNKSQFVVFVSPKIIESASQGSEEVKRKFRRRGR